MHHPKATRQVTANAVLERDGASWSEEMVQCVLDYCMSDSMLKWGAGLAFSIVHDRDVADDVYAEVIVDLFFKGGHCHWHGNTADSFRGFLYRCMCNEAAGLHRTDTRRLSLLKSEYGEFPPPSAAASGTLDRLADADLAMRLTKDLPPTERRALELHLGGHSFQEIAEVLNISVSTVTRRIARAKQQIALWIQDPSNPCRL